MIVFDAHLDLAMNALEWNRDLTQPIEVIREREHGFQDKPDRGLNTVCFPEMRRGKVALCVATQIARFVKPGNPLPGWNSPAQAWAQTQGQLAWYRAMEEAGQLIAIRDRASLREHLLCWEKDNTAQNETANAPTGTSSAQKIGYVLSLEGADSLISLRHLERACEQGLRAVGPAHYGPGTYSPGTGANGGFSPRGKELLAEMSRLGLILDVTHLTDESFWQALDLFSGPLWASHSNCRALVPHQRQLDDAQIKALIARGAVIGVAFDGWMLVPDWIRGNTTPSTSGLCLQRVVDHIDHICQLAGNALHVGIGSDLDGGFGREQTPEDLQTIADLSRLEDLLRARGYGDEGVRAVMHGNFVRFLERAWK